jgi:Uncharacterized protein conserved in bacteria
VEKDEVYTTAAEEVREFIERLERLESQISDIRNDVKLVCSEAKDRGYEPKILKKIVALRKRDSDDVATEEALLETYKSAIGM